MKNRCCESHASLGDVSVSPHCTRLLSDFGEVLCRWSSHNADENSWVSLKPAQGRLYFSYKRKWNYIYAYTVKPYDSLKVKNAPMKPVHYVTEYAVSSLVSSLILFKAGPTQPSPERFRRLLLGIKAAGAWTITYFLHYTADELCHGNAAKPGEYEWCLFSSLLCCSLQHSVI